jgi:hypothetical protein
MSKSDDLSGDDPAIEEFADEFERRRGVLYERICDFMEEEETDESYLVPLLIDAAVRLRMTAYGLDVESPSVAGLKLDLDRLRGEVNDFLRDAKKGAEEYIRHVKDIHAQADAKFEAEDEESGEDKEGLE